MVGALLHYITHAEAKNFQPMKATMGLLPEMSLRVRRKEQRYAAHAERARVDLERFLVEAEVAPAGAHAVLS
jgi:methylenetetrahydrofolate--tRNA-(uracil-5-)-methyltransferase